jgi:uncharacterized protein YecT (DUF1311 family)
MLFRLLALALMSAALCVKAEAKGYLPVATETIEQKTATAEVSVAYPQTGNRAIDSDLVSWARETAARFVKLANEDREAGERPYQLGVTFKIERNDRGAFAVLFDEYTDMGGAHPNHDFSTANYQLPDGWRVYLPELLDGRAALDRLSTLVTADLIRRIGTGADAESTPDAIRYGTAPEWGHFANFILEPARLSFYFPPYQVASYASGSQESHIPLAALKGFLRANVRVAVPSFDCTKAVKAIEKSVCADVQLARLDRQVAKAYAAAVRSADTGERERLRRGQREWLAQQRASCGSKSGRALKLCLMASYRARAKVLVWP